MFTLCTVHILHAWCNTSFFPALHIQILWEVDTILFSLLILRGLSDSQGRVWRCHPNQLYAVEVTLPNRDNVPQRDRTTFPESCVVSLLDLLPFVSCLNPKEAHESMKAEQIGIHKACREYI